MRCWYSSVDVMIVYFSWILFSLGRLYYLVFSSFMPLITLPVDHVSNHYRVAIASIKSWSRVREGGHHVHARSHPNYTFLQRYSAVAAPNSCRVHTPFLSVLSPIIIHTVPSPSLTSPFAFAPVLFCTGSEMLCLSPPIHHTYSTYSPARLLFQQTNISL